MALEAIVGSIVGGALRIAPEILSFLDKKNERKHELALGEQQYRVAELQTRTQLAVKDLDLEQSQFVSAMETLKAGIEAQGKSSGVKWVDAISSLVRPSVTAWIFVLYSGVKIAQVKTAMALNSDVMQAILSVWTSNDEAMLSSVIMFWFVGRVWKYRQTQ